MFFDNLISSVDELNMGILAPHFGRREKLCSLLLTPALDGSLVP